MNANRVYKKYIRIMKQPKYKAYIKSIQWHMDVISIYWNDDGTIEEILCNFEGNE
jgi:hypothetical protein